MHVILLFNNKKEISPEKSLPGITSLILTFGANYICSKVHDAFPVCCPIKDSEMAHMRARARGLRGRVLSNTLALGSIIRTKKREGRRYWGDVSV